ncbi:uncharacterized protein ARMOST_16179 [Armillaria ostoyae]|uniref:RNA-directed DNA polymerase n=1 Tax=Armillaria ostoyae TaxID=47428 RepID=A0A284RVF5_ARMOS|nr:uncharacterized protein ARMOST_16179 [Armillaria ostoyae]
MLTPEISPRHVNMLEYPLRPHTHGGGPARSHPMGGRYARGVDPGRDQGGHADTIQPSDPADLKLQSLPRGPGAPMLPDLPNPWDVGATQTNPWNELKPKIVQKPAPFKGESVDHWLTSSPHHVVFCASRFEGEAQVWWDLQQRQYYSDTIGHWRYSLYADFKKAVYDRFFQDANAKLKYQALKKLCQTDFKSGEVFFQKFEELALEADIIDNEGQMAQMVKEAVRKTAKDTIYVQPSHPPDTYEEWKRRILQIDYNYCLNRAAGGQQISRPNNAGTPKGNSGMTTTPTTKKMTTGTVYGGHISKNCPLQSWNKKKEEVRASTTEPSMGSKIEEVKDAAGNGWTYITPVVKCVSYTPHSILFAESRSHHPRMESHNRYAILAMDIKTVSITSSDEDRDVTESSTNKMMTQEEQQPTPGALNNSTAGASKGSPSVMDNHLTSSTLRVKVPGNKPSTIVVPLVMANPCTRPEGAGELGPNSSPEASSQHEQAAPQAENTTRIDTNDEAELAVHSPGTRRELAPEVTEQVGKSAFAVQTQSSVSPGNGTSDQSKLLTDDTIKTADEEKCIHDAEQKRLSKAAGDAKATATKEIAEGKEVTSAQAIERRHLQNKVAATNADACGPSLKRKSPHGNEAECPIGNDTSVSKDREAAKHMLPVVTPQEWLKPFETEWTWRAIKDAKNESAARAILLNWIHKTRAEEVIDNLLKGLRSSEHFHALDWLDELHKPKQYFIHTQNSPSSLLLPVVLETLEQSVTIQSKALIDSGCTGSSIYCDFVEKHGIPIQKTASPISVYNADGSRNKAGEITAYTELRLKIGDHSERIDLTITDLGSKEIFLGHDWLVRHNPVINWTTGSVTFARCHCAKNCFVLPDVDPDDEWELAEGETILSIDFEEAIEVCAVHKANELAAQANEGKEKKTFEQMVLKSYRDFEDLFTKENFDDLPVHKPWDYAIELVPNAKNMLDCKVYPLNPIEQKELDKFLDENLASGHIKPSKSPMASPFFFVKKKDGTLRPVQDYCKLNKMTIKNRYPLPLISELMDKLGSAKYFTKLDVRWGYNNVCIKKDDEWKAAFRTNRGLFEPTVMFFGLTNSPATFQWMMNNIFKDLIAAGKVTIYLDDILIFLKTLEEYRKITRRVLELLRKHKLRSSICMDPIKLAGIAEWPVPTKKKELQSFLGFANFYRRFIKGYSDIVRPMTHLTSKEVWTWGMAQQIVFQRLKNQFAIDLILCIPTEKGQFHVEADSSEGAIGAILSQEQGGKWRPIAFLSKALTVTERNYGIYDKELLAIMLALDEWQYYLMGAAVDFEIWTDHQNLQYFHKPQKLNRRQA